MKRSPRPPLSPAVDRVEIAFADYDIFILKGMVLRDPLGPESLIFDFQEVLHSRVFVHRGGGTEVKMFMGVLDLNVDDCPVVLYHIAHFDSYIANIASTYKYSIKVEGIFAGNQHLSYICRNSSPGVQEYD